MRLWICFGAGDSILGMRPACQLHSPCPRCTWVSAAAGPTAQRPHTALPASLDSETSRSSMLFLVPCKSYCRVILKGRKLTATWRDGAVNVGLIYVTVISFMISAAWQGGPTRQLRWCSSTALASFCSASASHTCLDAASPSPSPS